jgi:hypothetical protein
MTSVVSWQLSVVRGFVLFRGLLVRMAKSDPRTHTKWHEHQESKFGLWSLAVVSGQRYMLFRGLRKAEQPAEQSIA